MNYIQNLLRAAIIATLALITFGPPAESRAAPGVIEPDQFSCTNVTEIPQIECEVLVAIYNPEIDQPFGWLETTTPCAWPRIKCEDGHVTALDIFHGQLSSLPTEISNLTNLTELSLYYNQLSSLPTEIGNLTNLTTLDLGGNQLSSLPTEISNLTNLTMLDLNNNQFSSLPTEISNLTNLTGLVLSDNQLSSLPTEISNLTNLRDLYIGSNQLRGLPTEIGNLTNLTTLDLSWNQLSSLPTEIGNLTSLTHLDLWDNQLSSLPTEIGNLTNLTMLDLGGNQLSSLPTEIGNLTSLTTLYLRYNRLALLDNPLPTFITELNPPWDWATTQTTAPTDVKAQALGENRIELTWIPIELTWFYGKVYYEISVAKGGLFTVHGTTRTGASRYVIEGLTSGKTYEFRVRTYTSSHDGGRPKVEGDDQLNELWSDYSPVISATPNTSSPLDRLFLPLIHR